MALSTARRVSGRTAASSLITRETVAIETSARRATSWMVVIGSPRVSLVAEGRSHLAAAGGLRWAAGERRLERFSIRQYETGRDESQADLTRFAPLTPPRPCEGRGGVSGANRVRSDGGRAVRANHP